MPSGAHPTPGAASEKTVVLSSPLSVFIQNLVKISLAQQVDGDCGVSVALYSWAEALAVERPQAMGGAADIGQVIELLHRHNAGVWH